MLKVVKGGQTLIAAYARGRIINHKLDDANGCLSDGSPTPENLRHRGGLRLDWRPKATVASRILAATLWNTKLRD